MDRTKGNFSTKTALCYALLLLSLCAVLAGTVTFARYQWEFAQASYQFVPEVRQTVSVYDGHLTQEAIDSGRFSYASGVWEHTGSGTALMFCVANGTPAEFAQEEWGFTVRIAAGLAIKDPQMLTVLLSYTEEDGSVRMVQGTPEEIPEGSIQQTAFGDGWIYRFFAEGEELQFALTAGVFSYQNFTVTVTGSVPATLLDLQVTQLQME